MKYLLSPHNDDAVLFATFTILRERPQVITVFDSFIQPARGYKNCYAEQRRGEDYRAVHNELGADISFWHFRDDSPDWDGIRSQLLPLNDGISLVYAPAVEVDGHEHHNKLGEMAKFVFGNLYRPYMTYTKAGKSIGVPVPYEPEWVLLKLKALACYESQIRLPSCMPHFIRSQEEYYQP